MLNILKEPKEQQYRNLFNFCLKFCTKIILVIRDTMGMTDNCNNIIKILDPFLVKKYRSSEWSGTKLLNGEATIYLYQYNKEIIKVLEKFTISLFEWRQPNLPEDICFFDLNDNPIFTTISHENDAFVKASNDIENSFKIFFAEQNIHYEVVNEVE